jgi:hypothetical protein
MIERWMLLVNSALAFAEKARRFLEMTLALSNLSMSSLAGVFMQSRQVQLLQRTPEGDEKQYMQIKECSSKKSRVVP